MVKVVREGLLDIEVWPGVFYNPHMRRCRDEFTALFKALKPRSLIDAFAATGIRGLRYVWEGNRDAQAVFVDIDPNAVNNIKANLRRWPISGRVIKAPAEKVLPTLKAEWVELDPFGTVSPYLPFAYQALARRGYLSLTTTDLPALCGVEPKACMRYYCAVPLGGRLCHETGLRIFLAEAVRMGWRYGFTMEPVASIYHRHYFKILLRHKGGSRDFDPHHISMAYACHSCGYFDYERGTCPICGKPKKPIGPLWKGPMFQPPILPPYTKEDTSLPYFYDTHLIASKHHLPLPSISTILERLKEKGFTATRTHISPTAVRTNADIGEFIDVFRA